MRMNPASRVRRANLLEPAPRSKSRPRLIRIAYDRSFFLILRNPMYMKSVESILTSLLKEDAGEGDVTSNALLSDEKAKAFVIAKENGILAGGEEFLWLCGQNNIAAKRIKNDGEKFEKGDRLFELEGPKRRVLLIERTGVNLLQRMSGIATETRKIVDMLRKEGYGTVVAGTRKTQWGYLDKKAITIGSGFSHRLGLFESFLIKENHLASLSKQGIKNPMSFAIENAWEHRRRSVFIEIEVRNQKEAVAAAKKFREVQEREKEIKPCIIMMDNMKANEVKATVVLLKRRKLYDYVLLEASGSVNEGNVLAYAKAGVDACSLGYLTHSAKAIDISQKIV